MEVSLLSLWPMSQYAKKAFAWRLGHKFLWLENRRTIGRFELACVLASGPSRKVLKYIL
jgi:hypothetical protein